MRGGRDSVSPWIAEPRKAVAAVPIRVAGGTGVARRLIDLPANS